MGRPGTAVVWVLLIGGLTTACPQLRDDDFQAASSSSGDEPDTTAPSVLASSPRDGADGVVSDARIEISFSEPMNTVATEAAYGSSELPPSDVNLSWRDDDSVLVITPRRPLTIASGSSLSEVTAREYSLELGAGASDRAGNSLAPFSLTFAAAREVTQLVGASVDRTLSGNWRSDENYGAEVCEIVDATICVGDSPAAGVPTYRGFATFDLNALPSDRLGIRAATLSLTIASAYNLPFQALGALSVDQVGFASIGQAAFEKAAESSLGTLATRGAVGEQLSIDVTSAVQADVDDGVSQYRLRFERESVDDSVPNVVVFNVADTRLRVTCLVP